MPVLIDHAVKFDIVYCTSKSPEFWFNDDKERINFRKCNLRILI